MKVLIIDLEFFPPISDEEKERIGPMYRECYGLGEGDFVLFHTSDHSLFVDDPEGESHEQFTARHNLPPESEFIKTPELDPKLSHETSIKIIKIAFRSAKLCLNCRNRHSHEEAGVNESTSTSFLN